MGRTRKQIRHLNEARHQKKEKVHVTKYCTYKTNVYIYIVYMYIYIPYNTIIWLIVLIFFAGINFRAKTCTKLNSSYNYFINY